MSVENIHDFEVDPSRVILSGKGLVEYLERATEIDHPDTLYIAATGFESLAMESSDPEASASHIDRAEAIFQKISRQFGERNGYPTGEGVTARSHLYMMPVIRSLAIDNRMPSLGVMRGCHKKFIYDLDRTLSKAHGLITSDLSKDPELLEQYREFSNAARVSTTEAVLMHYYMYENPDGTEVVVPAFLNTEGMEKSKPVSQWHLNVFMGSRNRPVEQVYKMYIRADSSWPHDAGFEDDTISVVWAHEDMRLEELGEPHANYVILLRECMNPYEFADNLHKRAFKLVDALDSRTIAYLKSLENGPYSKKTTTDQS